MSKEEKKTEIIYFRESYLQSLLGDITSLGFLAGTVWFNQNYCSGSWFLNAMILILFMSFISAKSNNKQKTFTSKSKLLEYLQKDST